LSSPSTSPAALGSALEPSSSEPLPPSALDAASTALPESGTRPVRRLPVLRVAALLEQQRSLTLVEKFAQLDAHATSEGERTYRDLIPLSRPQPGEQYAFRVDLDACTGCKACVAACHTLNGLDEGEVFRATGLLHGNSTASAATQTLTSSCHHCLDPACMTGCPVGAYEKDPLTGIVRHLDDQCFGCQYCTLMCPYDAPKYNEKKGIVRKCDMCSERLAHGHAPACVDACPPGAITIVNVAREAVDDRARAGVFVPGVASPTLTRPTTEYTSRLPLDQFSAREGAPSALQSAHPSLVSMLTLTQLAAGTALLAFAFEAAFGPSTPRSVTALGVGVAAGVGVIASLFHLGRPWLAHRAVLGLRTSWLSREAVALGTFALLAAAYATALAAAPAAFSLPSGDGSTGLAGLQLGAALAGLVGVGCSVMVYAATQRQHWALGPTALRFGAGTLLLGASALLAAYRGGAWLVASSENEVATTLLALLIVASSAIRLAHEAIADALFAHADADDVFTRNTPDASLRRWGRARSIAWACGGSLPALSALASTASGCLLGSVLTLGCVLAAELLDRILFFAAAPAPCLPGSGR
jgi:formate dehydrogenase iron-sulfur subunit